MAANATPVYIAEHLVDVAHGLDDLKARSIAPSALAAAILHGDAPSQGSLLEWGRLNH